MSIESIIPAVIFSKDYLEVYKLIVRKMDGNEYWYCSYNNAKGKPLLIRGVSWYVYGNSIEEVLTKMWESIEADYHITKDENGVFVVV